MNAIRMFLPLAVIALAMTGCNSMPRPFAKKAPLPPPPLVQQPGVFTETPPRWYEYSSFHNLIDPRQAVSNEMVVIVNPRDERLAIRVGERVLGVPTDKGQLGVMILRPGEAVSFRDPGLGQEIIAYALILNDQNQAVKYVAQKIRWPRSPSGQGQATWFVKGQAVDLPTPSALSVPILSPVPPP